MERSKHPAQADRTGRKPLVKAEYVDSDGRYWAVLVPEGEEENTEMGIPIGPPDLSGLDLPLGIEVNLHNQLHRRGLLTLRDVKGRRQNEVLAALQAALKVDVIKVTALFR